VTPNNVQNFRFQFFISLHVDDKDVLYYIQKKLGIGSVQAVITEKRNEASFIVRKFEKIKFIIDIFDKQSLNTTKHLNFLGACALKRLLSFITISLIDLI
jgi:hypothetical protein